MSRPKIATIRGRLIGEATCESCDFSGPRTRERVRVHVADHSHIVHFVIRDITTYFPPEKPDA